MSSFIPFAYDLLQKYLSSEHAGLALGITFGSKTHISKALQDQMRVIGASHLLVLSGGNIALLGELLDQVMFFIPRRIKTLLMMVIITLFVLSLSLQGSVVRATIMYLLPKMGEMLGKANHKMYTLWLTFFSMIAWNINYLNDISFLLSFAALLGIFMFEYKPMKSQKEGGYTGRLKEVLHRQLHIGVSAQTFVLPLVFYYFNSIAVLGVISTLIISILIGPIMLSTIGMLLIGVLPLPIQLQSAVGVCLSILLRCVEVLALMLSQFKTLYIQY